MPKFNLEIDTKEYGFIDIKPREYKFLATCTSDACRLRLREDEIRTDVGVVKLVARRQDQCPDCNYFLFWDKRVA